MTHDKLLEQFDIRNQTMDGGHYIAKTLRAIIEFHKPNHYGKCYCLNGEFDGTELNDWPCLTIEIIKEELL